MTHPPSIQFNGVWKKFRTGEVHDSLRDLVPALFRGAAKRLQGDAESLRPDEFWALRDVSFSVGPGQTLGVIGHNGAGKSTVLKILTRILRPTQGSYVVRGRIGALIEVAAGFHPDLTGRENIFLQGAIMGMDKAHISRRLDEIIAFSEIESFIETPVKRFSSGMNARLGFAIAAHLDPDVLIIDEVLAVGDYSFQRKAFGRIRELARGGIPVVVVSHQLDRVSELCTDVLLLSRGAPVTMGTPSDVIGAYLRGDGLGDAATEDGDASPVIIHEVSAPDGFEIRSGEFVRILVKGVVRGDFTQHLEPVGFIVRSAQTGEITYCTGTTVCGLPLEKGEFELDVRMQMNVQPGIYLIDVGVFDRAEEKQLHAGSSLNVKVTEGTVFLGPTNMNAAMTLR